MKKLVKIFAVFVVCALALTALVACAPKPNTDYDTAKKNLEDNGYTLLAALQTGDEGAEQAFNNVASKVTKTKAEDIVAAIYATNDDGEEIQMIWFKSAAAAKSFYKEFKAKWDENDDHGEVLIGVSGKCVYEGTPTSFNATK